MAKLTGPLLSETAHGSVGKILTFSKRKSGQQARSYNKPRKIPSPKQRGQRRLTEFLVAQWQNMSDPDKATWNTAAKASDLKIAGYHYFLREAQRDLYTHHGLCAYWHLNEYDGGKVKDISSNNYDGTPEPSYPSNVPTIVPSRTTKFGNALSFDGADDWVNVGNQPRLNLGLSDFTIACWVHVNGDQNNKMILAKWGWVGEHQGFQLNVNTGGEVKFIIGNGTTPNYMTGINMAINEWVWLVIRRYGASMDCYLNNIYQKTNTNADLNIDTPNNFAMGATYNGGDLANILLDEVCIYNRSLSTAEMTTRYRFAK